MPCHGSLYRAIVLNDVDFCSYYTDNMWSSNHVTLLGSQNNFCGLPPGMIEHLHCGRLEPHTFWDMFWTLDMLEPIVEETNRYAHTLLAPKTENGSESIFDPWYDVDEDPLVDSIAQVPFLSNGGPRVKGGRDWYDLRVSEL